MEGHLKAKYFLKKLSYLTKLIQLSEELHELPLIAQPALCPLHAFEFFFFRFPQCIQSIPEE